MTATRKVGRPLKTIDELFPENWKDLIIEWSLQGFTEAEIKTNLCMVGEKFSTRLWFILKDRDEEFLHTLQMCKVIRQAWWEKQARTNLTSKEFQTGLWYACMKNMFGYRDKHDEKQDEELKDTELTFTGIPLKNGKLPEEMSRYLN